MRVEDCSKDGRTCPECNYVSHTTSDLMYHVARVHDFVLDYLPPHVKEKVVGLERHKARPEEEEEEEEKEEGTKTTKEVAVSHLQVSIIFQLFPLLAFHIGLPATLLQPRKGNLATCMTSQ